MKILITGIHGHVSAYLAEHLLNLGHEVWGGTRRSGSGTSWRLDRLNITHKIKMVEFDLQEYSNMVDIIRTNQFDQIYSLAAMSFVKSSFAIPIVTCDIDFMGVLKILDIIKTFSPKTRFLNSGSSEQFGKVAQVPQNENTKFVPRSPYGIAKTAAHYACINYAEAYNLFTVSSICFNMESPLRGENFVTRKISKHVARFHKGLEKKPLKLGNLSAQRDWSHAKDSVKAMELILNYKTPETFVISSEKMYSVKNFCETAFRLINRNILWKGEKSNEIGYCDKNGECLVEVDPQFYRENEVDELLGDSTKAHNLLNWKAHITFDQLVQEMVMEDIKYQN